MKAFALPVALLALGLSAGASAADYQAGLHYRVLPEAQPTGVRKGQVEVLEFFSWGCPHCYSFEPYLESGFIKKKPANVVLTRVPAAFNAAFQPLARAYYVAESLGVVEQVNMPMFREMHDLTTGGSVRRALGDLMNRTQRRDTEGAAKAEAELVSAIGELFARHAKVKEDDFRNAWKSFAVNAKMQRGEALYRRYQISGVPNVVVNGKFHVGAGGGIRIETYAQFADIVLTLASREAATAK